MNPMKSFLAALAVTLAMPMTAFAHDGVAIIDPYARVSGASATSGAAFMVIENHADMDDRLIGAASDVAQRVELHTHIQDANGVMQMREVEDGFVVPAHGEHALARGGDHVMFLGLTRSLNDGDMVTLTLTFEKAGEVVVTVPVDLNRKPMAGMTGGTMNHGTMNHGTMAPAAGN